MNLRGCHMVPVPAIEGVLDLTDQCGIASGLALEPTWKRSDEQKQDTRDRGSEHRDPCPLSPRLF